MSRGKNVGGITRTQSALGNYTATRINTARESRRRISRSRGSRMRKQSGRQSGMTMLCEKCGRSKQRICFPPIPYCTCDEPEFQWPGLIEGDESDSKEEVEGIESSN